MTKPDRWTRAVRQYDGMPDTLYHDSAIVLLRAEHAAVVRKVQGMRLAGDDAFARGHRLAIDAMLGWLKGRNK